MTGVTRRDDFLPYLWRAYRRDPWVPRYHTVRNCPTPGCVNPQHYRPIPGLPDSPDSAGLWYRDAPESERGYLRAALLSLTAPEYRSGCWLWLGDRSGRGQYPTLPLRDRGNVLAARLHWYERHGVCPAGTWLAPVRSCLYGHQCVNPDHKVAATRAAAFLIRNHYDDLLADMADRLTLDGSHLLPAPGEEIDHAVRARLWSRYHHWSVPATREVRARCGRPDCLNPAHFRLYETDEAREVRLAAERERRDRERAETDRRRERERHAHRLEEQRRRLLRTDALWRDGDEPPRGRLENWGAERQRLLLVASSLGVRATWTGAGHLNLDPAHDLDTVRSQVWAHDRGRDDLPRVRCTCKSARCISPYHLVEVKRAVQEPDWLAPLVRGGGSTP